jgi:hypothetical protein
MSLNEEKLSVGKRGDKIVKGVPLRTEGMI